MAHLLIRFEPQVKHGGLITFKGTRPNQAVYWYLQSYNPVAKTYGAAIGNLRYPRTHTNNSSLSINIYDAPVTMPDPYVYDVVTVRWND